MIRILICLLTICFSFSSAFAEKLVCELSVSGRDIKIIEGLSSISVKSGIFLCRAKKEEGEIIRLRIASDSHDESVNESGYRTAIETLWSVDNQGDGLTYATCECHLD